MKRAIIVGGATSTILALAAARDIAWLQSESAGDDLLGCEAPAPAPVPALSVDRPRSVKPRPAVTDADLAAIEAAQAKRARKSAHRLNKESH